MSQNLSPVLNEWLRIIDNSQPLILTRRSTRAASLKQKFSILKNKKTLKKYFTMATSTHKSKDLTNVPWTLRLKDLDNDEFEFRLAVQMPQKVTWTQRKIELIEPSVEAVPDEPHNCYITVSAQTSFLTHNNYLDLLQERATRKNSVQTFSQ